MSDELKNIRNELQISNYRNNPDTKIGVEARDIIEVHFTDGTVKECYIEEVETTSEWERGPNKVLVQQTKYTAAEINRFRQE